MYFARSLKGDQKLAKISMGGPPGGTICPQNVHGTSFVEYARLLVDTRLLATLYGRGIKERHDIDIIDMVKGGGEREEGRGGGGGGWVCEREREREIF